MYEIHLEKTFIASPEKIFGLFTDQTVFDLTGANEIECSFTKGGKFSLKFTGRGIINGFIEEVIENEKIILNWNVNGFEREPEVNTQVIFSLSESDGLCILKLEHNNIKQEESFTAKKNAWREILQDMENKLR